jgi:hypothetical protein
MNMDHLLDLWCIEVTTQMVRYAIYNGPTNALVCIKTLIQMSHTDTLKSLQHVSII